MSVRIPRAFYDDHEERQLPTPPAIRETKRHVWIDPTHPDMAELLDDAKFYADPWGPDGAPHVTRAAKAMLAALKEPRP